MLSGIFTSVIARLNRCAFSKVPKCHVSTLLQLHVVLNTLLIDVIDIRGDRHFAQKPGLNVLKFLLNGAPLNLKPFAIQVNSFRVASMRKENF